MRRVILNAHVVADHEICHGKPTFKGTRIMVWQVLEMLAAGESMKEILEDFPSLTPAHIRSALEYAAQVTGGERFTIFSPHETARR